MGKKTTARRNLNNEKRQARRTVCLFKRKTMQKVKKKI